MNVLSFPQVRSCGNNALDTISHQHHDVLNANTSKSIDYSPRLKMKLTSSFRNRTLVSPVISFRRNDPVIQINYPGTGNNSAFTYDAFGRTVEIVETLSGTVTSTKQFVRSDGSMNEARNSSGTVIAQYFNYGESIGGTSYYWTKDYLGSIREMANSTGAIIDQHTYDPYGRTSQLQGSVPSDFQYAGYYLHAPSGLDLTLNRFYNSVLGRWLNRDPIGESGGVNLYDYVGNNSISFLDPSGLGPFDTIYNTGHGGTNIAPPPPTPPAVPPPSSPPPDYSYCNRRCKSGDKCIQIKVAALTTMQYGYPRNSCVCPEDPASQNADVKNKVSVYLNDQNNNWTDEQRNHWLQVLGGLLKNMQ